MKKKLLTRRRFLGLSILTGVTGAAVGAEAKYFEPTWLKVRLVRIGGAPPTHRFVHFTDIHHKGDATYLKTVVAKINSLSPDFVCFTGDIIEHDKFLAEALEILSGVKSPMFGIPGNHDYWSKVAFGPIAKCFAATGGAWLVDEAKLTADGRINIIGASCNHADTMLPVSNPTSKNVLLIHYPVWAKNLGDRKFDLLLAGHSHGGQVRIPFYGAVVVPYCVDEYDLGLFQTKAGPLYVNPGIGYVYEYNVRFNCRPEITVIEI